MYQFVPLSIFSILNVRNSENSAASRPFTHKERESIVEYFIVLVLIDCSKRMLCLWINLVPLTCEFPKIPPYFDPLYKERASHEISELYLIDRSTTMLQHFALLIQFDIVKYGFPDRGILAQKFKVMALVVYPYLITSSH